ncbi:MAG: Uma2 family endonuclease [Alkalinema sp. RU_4_3]|nr:Uma2 family endonuclease [Alkalinema sp. RU_4_3]
MVTAAATPPRSLPLVGERRVALQNITWQAYQTILHALPQTRAARLTFDDGMLEISMPLEMHEQGSELIGLFIRILVVEMGLKVKSMRSTTLDREDLNRGAEPDNAYYIQNQPKVSGREVNLAQDPPPDLVVEVDITHTDIDKNRLYASMGVPEFWRFDGVEWQVFVLDGGVYQEVSHSPTFPWVEKDDLHRFLDEARLDEVDAEVNFRQWVRERLSP